MPAVLTIMFVVLTGTGSFAQMDVNSMKKTRIPAKGYLLSILNGQ